MRLGPVFIAAVAAALAGCLADPPVADPSADDRSVARPDELPWGAEGCRYVVSWGWVDGDAVDPLLPEGFTVRRSDGLSLPPITGGDTLFGVDAMVCESGMGLEQNVTPMQAGFVWAAADPPEHMLQEGVDAGEHYAMWDVLVPDEDRRVHLGGRGVPVRDGSAEVTDGPAGRVATLSLDGLGETRIQALPGRGVGPFDGSFAKMSEATGGALAWRAHAESGPRSTGEAVIMFPQGSWMAEVVGDTTLRGGYHAGTWSYDDARLVFLGR